MNLIGHTENESDLELGEVVITAPSEEIRKIAQFLSDTADRMDEMGLDYDHEHLSDHAAGFETSPHLIVVRGA